MKSNRIWPKVSEFEINPQIQASWASQLSYGLPSLFLSVFWTRRSLSILCNSNTLGSWLLIRQLSPSTTRHRRSILHFWIFWYLSGHRSSPVNRACKILYFVFFWHPTIYFYLLSRKLATLWRLHSNCCFRSRSFPQFWTRFRQLQHPSSNSLRSITREAIILLS